MSATGSPLQLAAAALGDALALEVADLNARADDQDDILAKFNARLAAIEAWIAAQQPPVTPPVLTESIDGTTLPAAGHIIDAQGRLWTLFGGQIAIDGTVDPVTKLVLNVKYWRHVCYQVTTAGVWYGPDPALPQGAGNWIPIPGDPSVPIMPPVAGSGFRVQDGRIIAPNGQPWIGRGINTGTHGVNGKADNIAALAGMASALVATFPGVNFLRQSIWLAALNQGMQPADLAPAVATLTAQGVVVLFDLHDYQFCLSGAQLAQVAAWWQAGAALWKGNPRVFFSAQNEPDEKGNAGQIDTMNGTLYDAVRAGGNTAPFAISLAGGWSSQGMNTAAYARMNNLIVDDHWYGWRRPSSTLAGTIADCKRFKCASGDPAILIGEYGVCGVGPGIDPGGPESARDVQLNPDVDISAAWAWRSYNSFVQSGYIPSDLVVSPWTGVAGFA
jgi:hypothetical protein